MRSNRRQKGAARRADPCDADADFTGHYGCHDPALVTIAARE
jgi:hypothetical protein